MDWDDELIYMIRGHILKNQVSQGELLVFASRLVGLSIPDYFDEEDLREVCRNIYQICLKINQFGKETT